MGQDMAEQGQGAVVRAAAQAQVAVDQEVPEAVGQAEAAVQAAAGINGDVNADDIYHLNLCTTKQHTGGSNETKLKTV